MSRTSRVQTIAAAAALALVVAAGAFLGAARWADGEAVAAASATASSAARNAETLFDSEFQKFSLLPAVLVEYPTVQQALSGSGTADLDQTLELLAARTKAAAIYVIRTDGTTVAASNAREPTSFVGQNYRFRAYFVDAMRRGAGEYFALGTVSHRAGLFLSRRVEHGGRILGVVVIKVEFYALERLWASQPGTTVVANPAGVVLISSRPAWRFRTIGQLTRTQVQRIERTAQFPGIRLSPVPLIERAAHVVTRTDGSRENLVEAATPLPVGGWTLHHWEPLGPALNAAWTRAAVVFLLVIVGGVVVAGAVMRVRERRRLHERAERELKQEVAMRTQELRTTNEQLRVASAAREKLGERFRAAREELAQANRLASIGQITAGVAHEINQPVAAIRTYADNALLLLDSGDAATTTANLGNIVQLADRIGRITKELRAFARRPVPQPKAILLSDAVDGTMLLMGDAIRLARATLEYDAGAIAGIAVRADRVRLEQILINLVQNSLDAMDNLPGTISFAVTVDEKFVELRSRDTGPGVPPELRGNLFIPFVTAKANGLGLGLGIAQDIARSFNGDLTYIDDASPCFLLRLPRA